MYRARKAYLNTSIEETDKYEEESVNCSQILWLIQFKLIRYVLTFLQVYFIHYCMQNLSQYIAPSRCFINAVLDE